MSFSKNNWEAWTSHVKAWKEYIDESWKQKNSLDNMWPFLTYGASDIRIWPVVSWKKVTYFDRFIEICNKKVLPIRQHVAFFTSGATDIRIWPVVAWQKVTYFDLSIEISNKKNLPIRQHMTLYPVLPPGGLTPEAENH